MRTKLKNIGSYEIQKQIGKGGNGTVYLARKGGNDYAVKILNNNLSLYLLERFSNEIEALKSGKEIEGLCPFWITA